MRFLDGTCRKLRKSIGLPGHVHELTFSCYKSLPLLGLDAVRQFMIEALDRARTRHALEIWAYVIMPNHAHLLLKPPDATNDMAVILNAIKYPVALQALHQLRGSNPTWVAQLTTKSVKRNPVLRFWQRGGGYDRNLVNSNAVRASIDYIHNNPVRAGLVTKPQDWVWSSARWYAGVQDVPLRMDLPSL